MADAEQYYQGLSEDHKRTFFPQRFYTEKIAALEAKIAALIDQLSGKAPIGTPSNDELEAAKEKIAALEARIAELEQKNAPADDAKDAAAKDDTKEDSKQAARKTKGRKKDASDGGGDAEGA